MKFAELWTDTICKTSNDVDNVFKCLICGKLNLTPSCNSGTFSKMQVFFNLPWSMFWKCLADKSTYGNLLVHSNLLFCSALLSPGCANIQAVQFQQISFALPLVLNLYLLCNLTIASCWQLLLRANLLVLFADHRGHVLPVSECQAGAVRILFRILNSLSKLCYYFLSTSLNTSGLALHGGHMFVSFFLWFIST